MSRHGDGWKVSASWLSGPDNLFSGYTFRLLNIPHSPLNVLGSDARRGLLYLSQVSEGWLNSQADFEITAQEEAPILAARLLTHTPLGVPLPPMEMRLGSTKGTNALLEHKGSPVGLLITRGFADLLAIGTQQRPDIFTLNIQKPPQLYQQVIEVNERLDARGKVLVPLTEEEMGRLVRLVSESELKVWAVAFLHSYFNPAHEQAIRGRLRAAGITLISCSSELAPAIRMVPRAQTAVVNAYLSEVIGDYLQAVEKHLPTDALRIMTSAGGLVGARFFQAKDSLLSGPAGGVVGAASVARLSGINRLLTLDMGGTSTDVARYDGEYDYQYETRVGTAHLFSPSLAIETVAAGGGSICQTDGMKLSVGPASAGAFPGPACYGAGGPLTLTDVNLLLGRLDPDSFGIPLNRDAAERAWEQVQQQLPDDPLQASQPSTDYPSTSSRSAFPLKSGSAYLLEGFLRIANEKMAEAIRKISVSKGYNPAEYTLLAFGGAGGQHACQVAQLLQMEQILIPYDAGLLSAFGMGQARIERFATRQILQPLRDFASALPSTVAELTTEAFHLLTQEGYSTEELEVRLVTLLMRFNGQDHALEVNYQAGQEINSLFRNKYESLYGHWVEGRTVEVESVKVMASTHLGSVSRQRENLETYAPDPVRWLNSYFTATWIRVPVYVWEEMKPGATFSGPSLLVSQNSTTLVEPGWQLMLDGSNNATLRPNAVQLLLNTYDQPPAFETTRQPMATETTVATDAVQLELFTNRFRAIAEEMGALLQRTAFSVNVKERLDFSCALLDTEGKLVVNAPHIPVHLGSLGVCVRMVRQALPMQEGDVVITNHPGFGGSHLPDITLISPVYSEHQLLGYVANRAHHSEVGGKRPGSMPPDARNLAEEGIVVPPSYLIQKGVAQWQTIEELLCTPPFPTRALAENLADLNAALASIQAGSKALLQLVQQEGASQVKHYMRALKNYSAQSIQKSFALLPEINYSAEEFLDDGTPLTVRIQVEKETPFENASVQPSERTSERTDKRKLRIDFSGTGGMHVGNLNANPAIVNSAVIYVLRLLSRENIPLNEGIMEAVELVIPPGLLNPDFPADPSQCPAVVGGNTETSQRLVDTLLKALGLVACSQGTMNNLLFGNASFGYYETIGGGAGAGDGFPGASAVHTHMTNTRMTDPEVLEFRYPVRLERFSIRAGSGGKGVYRGGDGIIREIRFLEPVALTLLTQHRKNQPYGLMGGENGLAGEQQVIRADGRKESLDGMAGTQMKSGDRIIIYTPGGGGYGNAFNE
jgi:5-oxoprolinase (ATP-hydrolysing)